MDPEDFVDITDPIEPSDGFGTTGVDTGNDD